MAKASSYPEKNIETTDRALGVDASEHVHLLDFGTAVESDVQTSLTDTTADRLMKVGAFGLGSDPKTDLGTITDITDLSDHISELVFGHNGWLTFSGVPGIPDDTYAVMVWPRGSRGMVWFYTNTDDEIYYTNRRGVGWQPVKQLYHSGNYPSDDAWTTPTLLNGWTGTARYIKRAGMVTFSMKLDGSSSTGTHALTLPSSYRPSISIRCVATNGTSSSRCNVNSDGIVDILDITEPDIYVAVTYPVI